MNRSKEGETGRSECEVTKTRYLEAEELREIWDLSWKSRFQAKLGHVVCVILTSSFRRFLLTSLPVYSGAQFSPSSCFSLLLLSPGPHTAAIHSAYSIHFLFVCLLLHFSQTLRSLYVKTAFNAIR